jgi:hypothetical protein
VRCDGCGVPFYLTGKGGTFLDLIGREYPAWNPPQARRRALFLEARLCLGGPRIKKRNEPV